MLTRTRWGALASSSTLAIALLLSLVTVPAVHAAPASDSTLSSLTVSAGNLDPAFDPAVTTYSVSVPFATTTFSFTPTSSDPDATLSTWNGDVNAAGASGSATAATLRLGPNLLMVTVTGEDGLASTPYTITVTREAPPAPTSDPRLSALAVSGGSLSPSFSAAVTDYTLDVPYATTSITVAAISAEPGVTITHLGRGTTGATQSLFVGGNLIQIRVTAADSTTRDYMLFVTRAQLPPTDVDLAALEISVGTLTPAFDPAVTSYTATVPYAVRTMSIGATANDTGNTVTVNNTPLAAGATTPVSILYPGGSSFSVRVTAPNSVEKSYDIQITRAAPSSNADLTGLALSTGTLSPSFANATAAYTATVPYLTTSVTVTGAVADATAILRVNGVDVASGAASASIPLPVGSTPIVVAATAEDGVSATTRTITVTREAPVLDLADFSVDGQSIAPAFDASVTAYTLEVPYLTSSIDVIADAVESAWDVTIDGVSTGAETIALPVGDTTVTVTVTALHGESKTYTLVVTRRAAPPAEASIDLGFRAGDVAGGSQFRVTGENLLPGSTGTVTMFSTPILLGSGTVLGDATLTLDLRLPASVTPGAHRLVFDATALNGTATSATVWFTVLRDGTIGAVSLTGPVAYTEAALASTGVEALAPLVSLAALLAAAGALLIRGDRRARRVGA